MPSVTRRALPALASGLVPLAMPGAARAADWRPTRPVRMVAPYAPGGGADITARLLAPPMAAFLGQPVVVENRPGAGGSIGAAEVARAPADGHTVMLDALAHVSNPAVLPRLPFDYATAFAPISQVTLLPQIMIGPKGATAKTLAAFIAEAKAKPGQLAYGSSGNATAAHLAAVAFLKRAGIEMVHVPYRGGGVALQDLLAGNLAFVFGTVSSSAVLARTGEVTPYGVTTATRIAALPEVPTIAEQGFAGYELNEWNGFYAPAGTPDPVRQVLHQAVLAALRDPAVAQRLETMGALAVGSDPAPFGDFLKQQRESMATLIREAGVTID
ncbi:tripartite tricarboxylate transporter substrate binding protein [Roseomonas sp. 18066]|uniref:Bug family tripartite tricarboxylate transporter substrate binding protein n=1 Tax=Roseomonas sp. 18066 TaxID=2681412 RepID=UPI00135B3D9E|nr:tripartite tricarboxylate transporter substrate-binding protein [Roseomonas sp. 18066]